MSLIKSTATIGGYTLISRVFGFLRDMLQAYIIGANAYSDAFFVAFKLPNFFRRIFAEGAFNAAFVPLFADALTTDGHDAARRFAEQAMAVLLVTLLFFTALLITIMPWFMHILAPGFAANPEKFNLAVLLTRITFPYLLFISLVSLLGGVLNSLERFAAVAATPILMNMCFIASLAIVWVVKPTQAEAVQILAVGVTISGVAQFTWLMFFCRRIGMGLRITRPHLTPEIRRLFTVMLPAVVGGSVAQINLMVDTIIASLLPREGSISYLYYADRINELPLAVVGIAVSTALLPMLSRQIRSGNIEAARHSQNRAIELTALLSLPASCALMVIAIPILTVLFERGAFGAMDTYATAQALVVYAAGLPAFILIRVLAPGFYAHHDTHTPFIIATWCIILNLVLNLVFIYATPLAHVGMALATTIAGWLNSGALAWMLYKRGQLRADAALRMRLPRILFSALCMGAVLYLLRAPFAPYFLGPMWMKTIALAILVGAGLGTYGACAYASGAIERVRLKEYFRKK